jgi:hypothetical protein
MTLCDPKKRERGKKGCWEEYGSDKLAISQNKAMMCEEISSMNNKLKLHFHHETDLEERRQREISDKFFLKSSQLMPHESKRTYRNKINIQFHTIILRMGKCSSVVFGWKFTQNGLLSSPHMLVNFALRDIHQLRRFNLMQFSIQA